MTELIKGIEVMDLNDIAGLNVKNKFSLKAFDKNFKSKVLFSDYSNPQFNLSIGLLENFARRKNIILADLTIYDVNGYDIEMPSFFKHAYLAGAFKVRPLVKVNKLEEGIIIDAEMICLGVIYGIN